MSERDSFATYICENVPKWLGYLTKTSLSNAPIFS